jgi:hypothetical protein
MGTAAALGLAALLGLSGSHAAARATASVTHHFQGTYRGIAPGAPVAGGLSALVTARGSGTDLGPGSDFANLTIYESNQKWTGCSQILGTQTLRSDHGGRIDLIFVAPSCRSAAPNVSTGAGHYLVVGGTQRFRGASGSGTSRAVVTNTGPTTAALITVTFSGTLTLPH